MKGTFLRYGFIGLLIGCCLTGCRPSPEHIRVSEAWTRPYEASAGLTTALYLTLENNTSSPIELIATTIPLADTVEIHQTLYENGMMRMRSTDKVTIASGSSLAFKPGGHHLMIKGLQRHLSLEDSLRFTLYFSNHPSQESSAIVKWE